MWSRGICITTTNHKQPHFYNPRNKHPHCSSLLQGKHLDGKLALEALREDESPVILDLVAAELQEADGRSRVKIVGHLRGNTHAPRERFPEEEKQKRGGEKQLAAKMSTGARAHAP